MELQKAMILINDELKKAVCKFPTFPTDPLHASAVVSEESGELVKASLHYVYEDGDLSQMEIEAIQTAVTAIRFLMHLDDYEPLESKQRRTVLKKGDK